MERCQLSTAQRKLYYPVTSDPYKLGVRSNVDHSLGTAFDSVTPAQKPTNDMTHGYVSVKVSSHHPQGPCALPSFMQFSASSVIAGPLPHSNCHLVCGGTTAGQLSHKSDVGVIPDQEADPVNDVSDAPGRYTLNGEGN
ncbi:hypothetical protein LIA77_06049 [Sarocladium implicatum]|nr:hypothetical protein LIA77_06049 [Sarocladium implicatum]